MSSSNSESPSLEAPPTLSDTGIYSIIIKKIQILAIDQPKPSPKISILSSDEKRLPIPCPLPTFTPKVETGMKIGAIKGDLKLRLLRESAMFYYGLCPRPTQKEYQVISIALCDMCPQLRDKTSDKCNWVSIYT